MTTPRVREAEPTAAEHRAEVRPRLRRGLRYCVAVFVAFRLGITVLEVAGVALLPGLDPVGAPGWPANETTPGWHNVVTSSERFDALWFLSIATEGYRDGDGSAAFFPGYPLLIRAVTPLVGGHPLAAALLVSNLAALAAMVVLYFLTSSEFGEAAARRAVLYLAVFPTSFFLLAPYSEAPFLLFALLTLWAARRGRWEIAGVAGAAAAATRNVGVLLVAPLLAEAVAQADEERVSRARAVGWSLGPAVGTAAYLFFWWRFSGDWLAPLHQQATWQREFLFPLGTLVAGTREAFRFPGVYPGGYHLLDWLVAVPALAAAVWVAARTAVPYRLYTWLSILAPLSFVFIPRPFMSLPRFLLVVFPLLWAPAVLAERRPSVHGATVAASSALLGIMTVLFAGWYYVF
ncbi:MAG TPA: mannosyltransferase family protein [Actinomycetota bacterium]|nr:mannosyltransferase family protein [Actinomycetota bacterium]